MPLAALVQVRRAPLSPDLPRFFTKTTQSTSKIPLRIVGSRHSPCAVAGSLADSINATRRGTRSVPATLGFDITVQVVLWPGVRRSTLSSIEHAGDRVKQGD